MGLGMSQKTASQAKNCFYSIHIVFLLMARSADSTAGN